MEYLNIPIVWGSEFDLRLINTSFLNLKFVKVDDNDFAEFFSKFFAKSFIVQNGFLPNFIYTKTSFDIFHKEKFAVVPTSQDYTGFEERYTKLIRLLQIVFPCDLQIERVIHIELKNPTFNYSVYEIQRGFLYELDEIMENQIYFFGKILYTKFVKIEELNVFLVSAYKNYDLYAFTVENYIQSYYTKSALFQFVALCMGIESTLSNDSKTEISYRFSRNASIICGISKENCSSVYSFLKQTYSLRSDIVHGNERLKHHLVYNNLTPLRVIVSTLLVNLLANGIGKKSLNDNIHTLGFGQKELLKNPFVEPMPNLESLGILSKITFKK